MLHLSLSSISHFTHQTWMLYALSVHLLADVFACPSLKEAWTVRAIKCVSELSVNWSEPSHCSLMFPGWWLGRQGCWQEPQRNVVVGWNPSVSLPVISPCRTAWLLPLLVALRLVILKTNCRLSCVSRILSIRSREVVILLCVALVRPCLVYCAQFWVCTGGILASWSESTKTCRGLEHITYKEKQREDERQQTQVTAWEIPARYKEENLHRWGSQILEEVAQKHCGISSLEVFNFGIWTRWPPEVLLYLNYSVVLWFCARNLSKCLTQSVLPL